MREYLQGLHVWRNGVGGPLSILSEKMSQDIAKRCQSWYNSDPVPI